MSDVVAAFDVDGTLTTKDTFAPFLRAAGGSLRFAAAAAAVAPRVMLVALRRATRDDVKRQMVRRLLAGRTADEIDRLGVAHASHIEQRWLRTDTVARLRWHQREGHRTVLVSASLRAYLRPLGAALGVDDVLCTDVALDGNLVTGELVGENCRGPEKAVRLVAWAGGRKPAELWAYGDSAGDDEMLALADRAVRVRRSRYLASVPVDDKAD